MFMFANHCCRKKCSTQNIKIIKISDYTAAIVIELTMWLILIKIRVSNIHVANSC